MAQSGSSNNKNEKPTKDPEAGWHVKNDSRGKKRAIYGFFVHTGVDEYGFIYSQSMTLGHVHDSQERDTLLLGDETALYAELWADTREISMKTKFSVRATGGNLYRKKRELATKK